MIGASHGGFLTLEYAIAHPEHLYGAIVGDSGAQWSHWAAMNAMKVALTDPRVKPDPEQLLRLLTGNMSSMEDFASGFASISPLYSVPGDLKDQAETDVDKVIAGCISPVSHSKKGLPHRHKTAPTYSAPLGPRNLQCSYGRLSVSV